ncbi:MAG TPA: hypothetical protein DD473_12690 [Planctomycetaceae bacterium]|nr:hypothetical protein [Planctomycetaceae bacterium]
MQVGMNQLHKSVIIFGKLRENPENFWNYLRTTEFQNVSDLTVVIQIANDTISIQKDLIEVDFQ